MRNIKITIEYDGTRYSGWQIQKNTEQTIQQILQDSLREINKDPVKVTGAGRTDAGVHALGQVANFNINVPIPVDRIPRALNRLLPSDIVCKEAEEVAKDFHARYDARGKQYQYRILNRALPSAFLNKYSYHFILPLDISLMREAAGYLEGTNDFSAFQASGSPIEDCVRTIDYIEILEQDQEILIKVRGDGFLYKMVRIIAGTLIQTGSKKIPVKDIQYIIESRERQRAGITAPAHGLTLVEVYYD